MRNLSHIAPAFTARVGLTLATLLTALTLAACGGGGKSTVVDTSTPAPAPAPTPAPNPPPSTDQGCTAAATHCAPQP